MADCGCDTVGARNRVLSQTAFSNEMSHHGRLQSTLSRVIMTALSNYSVAPLYIRILLRLQAIKNRDEQGRPSRVPAAPQLRLKPH